LGFLDWLEELPLSQWVAQSEVGYPMMLSIHSIGMAAVVGLLLMFDLRVLGLARGVPVSFFRKVMPFAWAGFFLNLVSGVLLFNSTAHRLVDNWPFLSKMVCILAAGAVTWLLWRAIGSVEEAGGGASADAQTAIVASPVVKALALASIILWLAAITFGRLIAYVMDYMILNAK